MPATVAPLPAPARPQDPATQAALAELLQLGLAVARVAARLAELENRALDALADAAAHAARALAATPASLGDALRAGREADALDAARDATAARVAVITECFDKAARAVRRTAALQARLADGRPFPAGPRPLRDPAPGPGASPRRPANDAEPPECADRPENGDEVGGRTDADLLGAIRRDLAGAAARLAGVPAAHLAQAPAPDTPGPDTPGPPGSLGPASPPPAPDT